MADRFTFFESFAKSTRKLPAEDFKAVMIALFDYAFEGEETESFPSEWAESVYELIIPVIKNGKTSQQNGEKGGRPKKEKEEKPPVSESKKGGLPKPKTDKEMDSGLWNMDSGEGDGDGVRIVDEEKEMEEDTGDRVPNGTSADEAAVLDHWNSLPDPIPKIKTIGKSGDRPRLLKARISEYSLAGVVDAIERIRGSDFLQGKDSKNGWVVSFDWFIKPQNFRKVAEGNYDGRAAPRQGSGYNALDYLRSEVEKQGKEVVINDTG